MIKREIDRICEQFVNDDNFITPNDISKENSKGIVDVLDVVNIKPNYVQPFNRGGIKLFIIGEITKNVKDQKWVQIICDNNDDITFLLSNGDIWFEDEESFNMLKSINKVKLWIT